MQGLEVIRVGLQLHLAQELILQDSVVPDLGGDRGWQGPESLSCMAPVSPQPPGKATPLPEPQASPTPVPAPLHYTVNSLTISPAVGFG